jgi:4-amino-4-deoxy-L-arabinose transferase-like glycosyltransferase
MKANMKKYFWLIAILVLATALRFYHNLDISLWHDEAFSALMIRYGWGEMFRRLALDVHPPMYYIFLRLWHYIFGDKLLSLRGFSIFFGVLTVWATWLFGKYTFKSQKTALWGALLVAVSTFQLQYVTEARMYTMGAFFSVLAAYFLVRALREQKEFYDDQKLNMPNLPQDIRLKKYYLWHYLWFAVCAGIMDFTHYYLLFTMAALCLYALVYHIYHYRLNYKRYWGLLLSYIAIVLFFLPWLKQFIFQYKQVSAGYWIPQMDIWSIPGTLWTMLLGIGHDNANAGTQRMLIVVTLFVIFFFWRFLRKTQYFEKWLVLFATLAPFGGAILFAILARLKGSTTSVFEERYFLFASTFFIIAFAAWLSDIKPKWLSVSLFVVYVLFNFYGFFNYWQGLNIAAKPGMNGAAKFLHSVVAAKDHVFVGTSYEFFNYKYYDYTYYALPNGVSPLLFTGGRSDISQISHVEGVALLENQDLLPSFSAAVHPADTVWLLWTDAFGSNKPQVPANWTQVDERDFNDVRPWVGTNIYVTEYKVN